MNGDDRLKLNFARLHIEASWSITIAGLFYLNKNIPQAQRYIYSTIKKIFVAPEAL